MCGFWYFIIYPSWNGEQSEIGRMDVVNSDTDDGKVLSFAGTEKSQRINVKKRARWAGGGERARLVSRGTGFVAVEEAQRQFAN